MDTSGFYKKTDEGEWWYAPNFVYHKNYTLERNSNREAIDGWEWYEKAPAGYLLWDILNNQELNVHTI
jgi:hypothetical protein